MLAPMQPVYICHSGGVGDGIEIEREREKEALAGVNWGWVGATLTWNSRTSGLGKCTCFFKSNCHSISVPFN